MLFLFSFGATAANTSSKTLNIIAHIPDSINGVHSIYVQSESYLPTILQWDDTNKSFRSIMFRYHLESNSNDLNTFTYSVGLRDISLYCYTLEGGFYKYGIDDFEPLSISFMSSGRREFITGINNNNDVVSNSNDSTLSYSLIFQQQAALSDGVITIAFPTLDTSIYRRGAICVGGAALMFNSLI